MLPILYESTEQDFQSNGLGRIPCTSCIVKEGRNGVYECTFAVAVTEEIYPQITEGRIIACIHDDKKDVQPFDIYGRSAPMNGLVTFYAHHISYRLGKITVKPFTASSCTGAIAGIKTNSINTNPFSFWTDKAVNASFKVTAPATARSLLAGREGSLLDVYGKGEYEFDKWAVKLHVNRGNDNGVTIRYAKNLTDIKQDTDQSSTYNAVAPYWISGEDGTVVTLTAGMVVKTSQVVNNRINCIPLDLSSEFDSAPTQAQLEAKASSFLDASDAWVMKNNLVVNFVSLWQTPEYEDVAALERVSLCDKVSVVHPILGIAANKIQVVEVEYDVLNERYTRMELGEPKSTYAEVIKAEAVRTVMNQVPSTDAMGQAITHATDMIIGAKGGHIVLNMDANGKPYEFLVMDTDDPNTAVNVWRFNLGGLGHSHSGYSGPYNDIALTADGQINADLITTGVLRAIQIVNGNDTFKVDPDGTVTAKAINIEGGSINITTQTESYDVIKLNWINPGSQYVTMAQYAPIGMTVQGYNQEEGETGSSFKKAYYQYGGVWFFQGGAKKSLFSFNGTQFFNDDESTKALYNRNGLWVNDTDGTEQFTLQDSGLFFDDKGSGSSSFGRFSLRFNDDSNVLRGNYQSNSLYYYDSNGKNRTSLQTGSLTFKDASEVVSATYGSTGYSFYDSAGTTRSQAYSTGYLLKDDTGQTRFQIEAQKISMRAVDDTLLREDLTDKTNIYGTNGTIRGTYADKEIWYYNTDGDLVAHYGSDNFYYTDASTGNKRAYQTVSGMTYRAADNTQTAFYGAGGWTLYDSSGNIRLYSSAYSLIMRDDQAVNRALYQQNAIFFFDADGTNRTTYQLGGLWFNDDTGQNRSSLQTDALRFKNASDVILAYYGAGSIYLYDTSGNQRMANTSTSFTLKDNTGQDRLQIEAQRIRMWDSDGSLERVDEPRSVTLYPSGISTPGTVLNTSNLLLYDSTGQARSKVTNGGMFESRNASDAIMAQMGNGGFNICNASSFGVMIDGTGYTNGTWVWKSINANDGYVYMIPAQQVGNPARINGWQGVNLLNNTTDFRGWDKSSDVTVSGYIDYAKALSFPAYYTSLTWKYARMLPRIPYSRVKNVTVTLSFWYRSDAWYTPSGADNVPVVSFEVHDSATATTRQLYRSYIEGTAPTTSWQRWVKTIQITDDMFTSGSGTVTDTSYFTIAIYQHNQSHLQIMKPMLEAGNAAHTWLANPVDITSRLDALEAAV